ncbi:hypothetical protein SLEP1_g42847 [Rubroshorea leprosula]|uniref:Uncharacterized protein n=1 Tax=Rubroshorea leprosula TaxID=152421 RepID=A0AAV5LB63_9ROSI|nr:hypothetical protein SLEP1_g42847 [Rubroshorea leprosula]
MLGSLLDEEGKAVVGFLQVDEDEEGIAVGFDFEPSKQSNLASNPAAAGFLQCWVRFRTQQALCSSWVPAGAGFDFEPNRHWVPFLTHGSVEFHLFIDLFSSICFKLSSR